MFPVCRVSDYCANAESYFSQRPLFFILTLFYLKKSFSHPFSFNFLRTAHIFATSHASVRYLHFCPVLSPSLPLSLSLSLSLSKTSRSPPPSSARCLRSTKNFSSARIHLHTTQTPPSSSTYLTFFFQEPLLLLPHPPLPPPLPSPPPPKKKPHTVLVHVSSQMSTTAFLVYYYSTTDKKKLVGCVKSKQTTFFFILQGNDDTLNLHSTIQQQPGTATTTGVDR